MEVEAISLVAGTLHIRVYNGLVWNSVSNFGLKSEIGDENCMINSEIVRVLLEPCPTHPPKRSGGISPPQDKEFGTIHQY